MESQYDLIVIVGVVVLVFVGGIEKRRGLSENRKIDITRWGTKIDIDI